MWRIYLRAILHTDIAVNTLAVLTRCTYSKECVKIPPHARISHIFTTAPGIDKAHLFKRVCKGAATRAVVTPEHDTIKNMDKIVFLCYYVNRNCEVEDYGCHKLYG